MPLEPLVINVRTVSSALKAMGLDQQKNFHRYHRVLWSYLELANSYSLRHRNLLYCSSLVVIRTQVA
jgi:hypothetical protein